MKRGPLHQLFASSVPFALLLASLGLALLSEALVHFISDDLVMLVGGAGLLALALALVVLQNWWSTFSGRQWLAISERPAEPARVLFVTASEQRDDRSAAGRAIEHHSGSLERVFVLYTEDETGKKNYLDLQAELARLESRDVRDKLRPCPVPARAVIDPRPTYDILEQRFHEALDEGFDCQDVVFDYTGGSKAFTAAMTLAGAEGARRLQYVAPQRDENGKYIHGRYVPTEIDLRFRVRPRRRRP